MADELIRTFVPLQVTKRMPRAKPEVRLFSMDQKQAETYDAVVRGLAERGPMPVGTADGHVLKVVTFLLQGAPVPLGAPHVFDQMRTVFPVLSAKDIESLPRHGCPRGRQRAVILTIAVAVGDEQKELRTVRYDFNPHQREVFHQSVGELARRASCSRDEAWETITKLVGRTLSGGHPVDGPVDRITVRLTEAFVSMTNEEAFALPRATDSDVRELQFTEERP